MSGMELIFLERMYLIPSKAPLEDTLSIIQIKWLACQRAGGGWEPTTNNQQNHTFNTPLLPASTGPIFQLNLKGLSGQIQKGRPG